MRHLGWCCYAHISDGEAHLHMSLLSSVPGEMTALWSPQLISLSQTSAIWEVLAACNLRLLVQWQPFPAVWWAVRNSYIQTDLIFSPCTKYWHQWGWGIRILPLHCPAQYPHTQHIACGLPAVWLISGAHHTARWPCFHRTPLHQGLHTCFPVTAIHCLTYTFKLPLISLFTDE